MPIYIFNCPVCGREFEEICSFEQSEKPQPCPSCGEVAKKVPAIPNIRMTRIYDNAEYGPRAFFGEEHAGHENWKDLAEESQMVQAKRDELAEKGKLEDFVFEEGEYKTGEGEPAKTIEEV